VTDRKALRQEIARFTSHSHGTWLAHLSQQIAEPLPKAAALILSLPVPLNVRLPQPLFKPSALHDF
jgi:hypothetical protein